MGSASASITATYKALSTTTYTLTVNNGTGGGSYASGTVISISANAPPSGKVFDVWTGTSGVANVNSASTTFTMGSANAAITATYKNATANETIEKETSRIIKVYDFQGNLIRSTSIGSWIEEKDLPKGKLLIIVPEKGPSYKRIYR
jgi:hypothetical protein